MADPRGKLITPVAFRADATPHALEVDDADNLKVSVAAQELDVEVVQQEPADLTPGIHGWDGSDWKKLPLVWGYSSRHAKSVTGTATDVGDAIATVDEVNAGEVWVIEQLTVHHNAGADKITRCHITEGAVTVDLLAKGSVSTGVHRTWHGRITLAENDTIIATATAPGDGKLVIISVWGYKMKIAE